MLDLIKNDDGLSKQYTKEDFKNFDWNMFLDLAVHHRVYPLLGSNPQSFGSVLFPQFVVQTINNYYKKNIFKMLHLCGEMEQLAKVFKSNGMKVIF